MDKQILVAALKENGSYYDIASNTLYITPAFKKRASMYGTAECDLMDRVRSQNNALKIEEYKSTRKARITYDMMETFICNMPSAEKNFKEFERVKAMSHAYRSPFKFVSDWFDEKYPYYHKLLEKAEDGSVKWNALEMFKKAQAEAEKRKEEKSASDEKPVLTLINSEKEDDEALTA